MLVKFVLLFTIFSGIPGIELHHSATWKSYYDCKNAGENLGRYFAPHEYRYTCIPAPLLAEIGGDYIPPKP